MLTKTQNSLELLQESKKLEILLSQSRVSLFGGCLVTTIVVILFWTRINQLFLGAWLSFYCAATYARYILLARKCPQHPREQVINKTRRLYTLLTFLCGASWGVMSVYILHADILAYGLFVVIFTGGMAAGATALYAIYPLIFASFAFPALLPLSIYLLLQEVATENIYGAMALVFLALMTISVIRMRKIILESIGIQFENNHLMVEIEKERKQVSDLNAQLELELEQLRQRDTALNAEKDKAENLVKKLLILSTMDGLTGIANRRRFDEFLAKEWNRAIRAGTCLSLILCDIDHFKAYNDHYGHQQGDRCLQQISSILEEHTRREGDLAARYGGEEFAIVLSDRSLEKAVINAENIKTALENIALPHEASDVSNIVTISMGVTTIQPHQDVFTTTLIAEADKLLYRAKAEGRNRIVSAEVTIISQQESPEDSGGDAQVQQHGNNQYLG